MKRLEKDHVVIEPLCCCAPNEKNDVEMKSRLEGLAGIKETIILPARVVK